MSNNNGNMESIPLSKEWKFKVEAETLPGEVVAITGNCDVLGNWSPDGVFLLSDESGEIPSSAESSTNNTPRKSVWSALILLPKNYDVCFRYCIIREISSYNEDKPKKIVKRWETFRKPRFFKTSDLYEKTKPADKFGFYNEKCVVERGWLNAESAILITVSKKSVNWHVADLDSTKITLEVTAQQVVPRYNTSESLVTEVAVLNDGEKDLHFQNIGGTRLDNLMMFITRSLYPDNIAFQYNFYKMNGDKEEKLLFARSNSWFSSGSNFGEVTLSIVDVTGKHCGEFTVKYIKIHPTVGISFNMRISYAKYWKKNWKGLEVGHRGAGTSFKNPENNVRENTIGAFKVAANNGADMLEFDVQVTKDGIPIIYHDFHVLASVETKLQGTSENMKIRINELTYKQLCYLKLRHTSEEKTTKTFPQDGVMEFTPFPALETALKIVDVNVPFNVEIKYPQKLNDGTNEADYPIEINEFLDRILTIIFKHAGDRYIVFSSFNPDICTMVRLKQNKYAVLFLTTVTSDSWIGFVDPRATGISMASYFCNSMDLLGVVAETGCLLKYVNEAENLILKRNLVLFCYGTDNNNDETVSYLKKIGLHAIIHDRFLHFIKEGKGLVMKKEIC